MEGVEEVDGRERRRWFGRRWVESGREAGVLLRLEELGKEGGEEL